MDAARNKQTFEDRDEKHMGAVIRMHINYEGKLRDVAAPPQPPDWTLKLPKRKWDKLVYKWKRELRQLKK